MNSNENFQEIDKLKNAITSLKIKQNFGQIFILQQKKKAIINYIIKNIIEKDPASALNCSK